MKKRNLSARQLDAKIDALLAAHSAKPSADFTAAAIAKTRLCRDADDSAIDARLAAMCRTPKADFTRRTVALATRRNSVLYYLRPALAAAASVAICLGGIRMWESPRPQETMAVEESADMEELMALARALDEAAPLLEGNNVETLTCLIDLNR
jgi:hypothetical protein